MILAPSGRDDAPALDWDGRIVTYGELDEAVERWPDSGIHDASALTVPDAVICVLAAARRNESVVVVDPGTPPRPTATAPPALHVATSGSSGTPRALARTYASWADSFPAFTSITGLSDADSVLVTGPLHATMHLFGALHALTVGACVTDDPTRATATHAVPSTLRRVLSVAPCLRTAVVAGTSLDLTAAQLARDRGIRIVEYYGAAELSIVATRVDAAAPHLTVFPGVEVDERDGVLWVRSPFMASGLSVDDAGWFSVGDLGRAESDALTVHGRSDAAINVGGTTVIAEDLEATLSAIPGVRAVAVIGEPHAVLGEVVTAVLEMDSRADLGAIRAAARATVGREALPRRWIVRDRLPRTTNGKIARAEIGRSVQ